MGQLLELHEETLLQAILSLYENGELAEAFPLWREHIEEHTNN